MGPLTAWPGPLRVLGQDAAVGVDEVIADAPGGDDLVGGHAVLLDAENVAAGGQARNGDLAVFIHGNALAGEAVEGHLIGDGGAATVTVQPSWGVKL